jgi:hypothetical protein
MSVNGSQNEGDYEPYLAPEQHRKLGISSWRYLKVVKERLLMTKRREVINKQKPNAKERKTDPQDLRREQKLNQKNISQGLLSIISYIETTPYLHPSPGGWWDNVRNTNRLTVNTSKGAGDNL